MPAAIQWTESITEGLVDRIIAGESICTILKSIGISEPSFYRHRLDDEVFESTIARAQEMAQEANIDKTEQLAANATAENWQLVQFQCRNAQWIAGKRKPKKYGDRIQQEHSGPNGEPIKAEITVEFVSKPVELDKQ